MNLLRIGLLGLLAISVNGFGQSIPDDQSRMLEAARRLNIPERKYAPPPPITSPYDDLVLKQGLMLLKAFPQPESDWQSNEKSFYQKILLQGKFDTLVVPLQVMGWSFDRSTRSLMTAELALAIGRTAKVNVPDPYLVAKALGDGQRQFKNDEVNRLADSLGVKRIVWGYVGHDRKGNMRIALLSRDRSNSVTGVGPALSPETTANFENLAFTDETPPIAVYEAILPDMLKALGLNATKPLFDKVTAKLDLTNLPLSPSGLSSPADNPARDAYSFLLYRSLTPALTERAKERFAEKALLAQLRLSPASPEYRALRARTYMALGYRLAALKQIDPQKTDEERELFAALNGNLPEVRAIASREMNAVKRVIEKLDENEIASAYGVAEAKESLETAQALKLPGNVWPLLASRSFVDADLWSQFENAQLKMLLDDGLPVKGYSLKDIVQGAMSVGDTNKMKAIADLSVFHHGRKFVEQNADKWCCQTTFNRPGELDYLELLQSIGHSNLIRSIEFQTTVQGRPEKAISIANSIDAVYRGHPYYVSARARAEYELAQKTGGGEKDSLLKSAYVNAFNVYFWEQGQSMVAERAQEIYQATGRKDYGYPGNFYYTDIPYRPYYETGAEGKLQTHVENGIAALKNATFEFVSFKQLIGTYNQSYPNESRTSDLLKSASERFIGSPDRNRLFATEALRKGDFKLAESFYRDNLMVSPKAWVVYQELGTFLLQRDFAATQSSNVFLAYPGFKRETKESRVAIANNAYEAGSLFYWSGYPELAKPFYALSSSQGTGAASEIASSLRLKLMDGNILGAMAETLEGARRYQDNYRYQDYLAMLHASGQSQEAWRGFDSLAQGGQGAEIVESALVGHRINAISEEGAIAWAKKSGLKDAGRHWNAASSYLLQFSTTDRTPSKEIIQAIDSLDLQRFKVGGSPRLVYGIASRPGEQRIRSSLTFFAEAYRALKLKDFVAAKSVFDEAFVFDDPTAVAMVSPTTVSLPYYAMAAVKTKDTARAEKLLGRVQMLDQGFYYHLAKAVLAGGAGESEQALQSLNLARTFVPSTENWPLIQPYLYGEVAEWVFETTGNTKINALTIDWAKKYQNIQPWFAWPYAMEAKLTLDPIARQRAIAMAYYLDPKSERLSTFKKLEIDEAVKAFGKANPFLQKLGTKNIATPV